MWEIIGKIAAVVMVGGSAGGAVARFIAENVAAKRQKQWQHEYDTKLENLRSDLSAQNTVVTNALGAAASVNVAAQERRLNAIEGLWKQVTAMRTHVGELITWYDVLTPDNYHHLKVEQLPLPDFDALMPRIVALGRIENLRPFLGSRLWTLFFSYRAVTGSLAIQVVDGVKKRRQLPRWDEDAGGQKTHTIRLLEWVLSEDELRSVHAATLGGPQKALDLLEYKMLAEIERLMSGAVAADLSAAEGKKQLEALGDLRRIADESKRAEL